MKTDFLTNDVWVTNTCMVIVLIGILVFTYVDIERMRLSKQGRSVRFINGIAILTFFLYLAIVLYATLIGRVELGYYKHIFRPLTSYKAMLAGSRKAIYDNIQNVLFFIPMGIYLFFFFHPRMKWYHAFFICGLFSGLIETTQLIARLGCCQTADVINNAFGGLVGFLLALLLNMGLKRWDSDAEE